MTATCNYLPIFETWFQDSCQQSDKHLGSAAWGDDDMIEEFRSVYSYFVFAYPIILEIVERP